MANPTAAQRKVFAATKVAMPDGSYYVRPDHPEDLPNAVAAVGRASGSNGTSDEQQRNAVRRHIITRAKALKRSHEIPPTWSADGTLKHVDVEEFIAHFGRLGMKWGQHRFGKNAEPRSPDSARAHSVRTQAKSSGVHTLSNDDLQAAITRMNLESQFSGKARDVDPGAVQKGRSFVKSASADLQTGVNAYNTGTAAYKIVKPLIEQAAKKK
jgi:hypothetical protein